MDHYFDKLEYRKCHIYLVKLLKQEIILYNKLVDAILAEVKNNPAVTKVQLEIIKFGYDDMKAYWSNEFIVVEIHPFIL